MYCLLMLGLVMTGAPLLAQDGGNVVVNGDFSETKDHTPIGWETSGDPKTTTQAFSIVEEDGNPVAKLACTRCEGKGGWTHAMICQVGGVKLEKGKSYEFSCRARAEGLASRNVRVMIQDTDGGHPCGFRTELSLAETWGEFRHVFKASRSAHKSTRLQFWFNEKGTFYLDDVRIAEIASGKAEFTYVVPDIGSKNLVPNGSFEAGRAGWSSLGHHTGWGDLATLHGHIGTTGGAEGKSYLRIPLGGENTPVLQFDYYEPVVRRETRVLASNLGWIGVEPGKKYVLSCYMRSSVGGVRALVGVRARDPNKSKWDRQTQSRHVKLTEKWKHYSHTFTPKYPYVFVTVGPDLEAELETDVDIDGIQLEQAARGTGFEPRRPFEVSVEPSEPSGIFTCGKPAHLEISTANYSRKDGAVRLEFDVTDFFGRKTKLEPVEIPAPSLEIARKKVALPDDWKGSYKIDVFIMEGEKRTSLPLAGLRVAFVPPRAAKDSVLGINHSFAPPYLMRLAAKAGVTWYRDWSLKWQHIEPVEGEYHWDVADPQIDRVKKEGAHVIALLPPFPSANWISEAPVGIPEKGYPENGLPSAWAPKDPAKLGGYVGKAVTRYKNRVKVWEFLNEPVYTTYALPGSKEALVKYGGKRYTPKDYVALLATAAAAMRKADPECRVMGGIGGGPDTLVSEVIAAGVLQHVDIFNLHIYPGKMSPEGFLSGMDTLLRRMDGRGGRKPIWITEFSYYGVDNLPRRPFILDNNSWAEERFLKSERKCAEYTVRFIAVMLSRNVEKVFLHSGASGSVNAASPECCLFDYGGAPRKVFAAMAVLTDLLGPAPQFAGEKRLGTDGYCMAFDTENRAVLILWKGSSGGAKLTADVDAPGVKLLDIVGGALPGTSVTLSETPVYAIGPAGAGRRLLSIVGGR
jgi:hypothetical protein